MKVKAIMTRNVKVCRIDDALNVAAQQMWENDCGCVPVISADGDGKMLGIITDRDICMAAYTQGKPLFEIEVGAVMTKGVICCGPDADILKAEALMRAHQVRRVPVVDNGGRLIGIVALNDLAREAARERRAGAKPSVTEIEVARTLESLCKPRGDGALAATAA